MTPYFAKQGGPSEVCFVLLCLQLYTTTLKAIAQSAGPKPTGRVPMKQLQLQPTTSQLQDRLPTKKCGPVSHTFRQAWAWGGGGESPSTYSFSLVLLSSASLSPTQPPTHVCLAACSQPSRCKQPFSVE